MPLSAGTRRDSHLRSAQAWDGGDCAATAACVVGSRNDGCQLRTACLGGLGSNMPIEIGHVEAIFRYPVKSMGGERLEVAKMGWHGLDGDRRLAFRRSDDRSGFPWLIASKLPDLLLFAPHRREDGAQGDLPSHIPTPD